MTRYAALTLLVCSNALAQGPARANKVPAPGPVAVARTFLPPNSYLATLYSFNFRLGRVVKRWPAVLTAHVLAPDSHDIVFAYYTPRTVHRMSKTLFVALLHRGAGGYQEVYVVSYRDHVLLIPDSIRVLRLKGLETDAISVVAGVGAALGGRLDVFIWRDPWGWRNVFPPNSTGYTYFFPRKSGLEVALSTANHPGLNVSPPPLWYRWDGKRFIKVPPPKGSAGWPLPD